MANKMKKQYYTSVLALLGFVIPGIVLHGSIFAQSTGISQNAEVLLSAEVLSTRISFVPPIDEGSPRRTRSGASRTGDEQSRALCSSVVPLLPETGAGLTSAEQMSLFVYVPEGAAEQAKLSVESLDGSEEFDTFVQLPPQGHVAEIALPETLPSLKTGESYSWSLVLMCNGELRPDSPVVTGSVKRVEAVLATDAAETLSIQEKAVVYGEAGLWYDLVDTLVQLRIDSPNDSQLVADWTSILRTVGLDAIADKPLSTRQ